MCGSWRCDCHGESEVGRPHASSQAVSPEERSADNGYRRPRITSRSDGHLQRMDGFRWTRPSRVAALVAGAITCLVVGMLAGVLASGGRPHNVLQVITDPASPASAHDVQPKSGNKPVLPTLSPTTTVTSTTTITAPAKTVATPTQTVTETETQTVTEPAPTSTSQTTTP